MTVNSCMIIDAEIYGMIPNAKIEARERAPPENMLNMPRMVPFAEQTALLIQLRQYQELAQTNRL